MQLGQSRTLPVEKPEQIDDLCSPKRKNFVLCPNDI